MIIKFQILLLKDPFCTSVFYLDCGIRTCIVVVPLSFVQTSRSPCKNSRLHILSLVDSANAALIGPILFPDSYLNLIYLKTKNSGLAFFLRSKQSWETCGANEIHERNVSFYIWTFISSVSVVDIYGRLNFQCGVMKRRHGRHCNGFGGVIKLILLENDISIIVVIEKHKNSSRLQWYI